MSINYYEMHKVANLLKVSVITLIKNDLFKKYTIKIGKRRIMSHENYQKFINGIEPNGMMPVYNQTDASSRQMKGVYFDKKAKHYRVRVSTSISKDYHIGTTKSKEAGYAMYDLFRIVTKVTTLYPLNFPHMSHGQLIDFINKHDKNALNKVEKSAGIYNKHEK